MEFITEGFFALHTKDWRNDLKRVFDDASRELKKSLPKLENYEELRKMADIAIKELKELTVKVGDTKVEQADILGEAVQILGDDAVSKEIENQKKKREPSHSKHKNA